MSEQEKKSGSANSSPLVVLENTGNSRHKPSLHRHTQLQDDSELHHKRSKAPAVPSAVAEELKNLTQKDAADENKPRKEHAVSSEKVKQTSKTPSPDTNKRGSTPESIPLIVMDVEEKNVALTPSSQPIPDNIELESKIIVKAPEKEADKNDDADSITDEITELNDPNKKYANWDIDGKSQAWILERRASVGPCYRPGLPFEGPSGITIHMPKKSTSISRPSGISINISRRNISTKSLFQNIDLGPENEVKRREKTKTGDKFFVCLKGTFVNVQNKIKRVFNC
ncbi:uncharacterized protein LOC126966611 isoform X2 [Leptidea sinapis]|uniref:uncharacterized protein LOC126966611 isoform X2 n=1 Tax=Leptidea sinapis TaxID=189913 RepID=UPI0021C3D40B|nr:uncharacterized protein LOC126966611 isoform X2 [Leptidea sinapis]